MAALAGMSTAAVATGPRLGGHRNRNALHRGGENVPLRPVVRNSVSWDDGIKPSASRLKQLNEYPPLLNETWEYFQVHAILDFISRILHDVIT